MTAHGRDTLVARLRDDLVGPDARGERLADRPGDRYLTGILWPPDTVIAPEEDERLGVDGGDDESDEGDDVAPLANARRPHACGLSFSVEGPEQSSLVVEVRCGKYEAVEPTVEEKLAGRKKPYWQRRELFISLPVEPNGRTWEHSLEANGLAGLSLYAVTDRVGSRSDITLILQNVNPAGASRSESEARSYFQVQLSAKGSGACKIVPRSSQAVAFDDDERAAALIYRDSVEFASGHTCAAMWNVTADDAVEVTTSWTPCVVLPGISADGGAVFDRLRARTDTLSPLSSSWLGRASPSELAKGLTLLPEAYELWLAGQARRVENLPEKLQAQAHHHIEIASAASARLRSAIGRLESDDVMRDAFQFSQRAMALQAKWVKKQNDLVWRPFQLGFQLLTLESTLDEKHADRATMDLLWFPTGGGKTEAYLALVAFVLFGRRLRDGGRGAGVAVLMRYTLRLLTVQQFQRAAALVLACEYLRRTEAAHLKEPFSIGLWVGGSSTPNSVDEFLKQDEESESTPKQLKSCPCCQEELNWQVRRGPDRVVALCQNPKCALGAAGPDLPIWTVDEDVYRERPSLVIGTVDKFAQLARRREPGALFGLDGRALPPSLIIQDELHLISGPLGTMTALYEVAIDELCAHAGARPKIIGSTATIRKASDQVRALFNRETFQFPPPVIDAGDSGFATNDASMPGRMYVGVSTAGRSPKFTLQAIAASLLQSATDPGLTPNERDWYWTLVGYFNSLRELGGTLVLMLDDVNQTLRVLASRRHEGRRDIGVPLELTSRRRAREIPDILENLERRHAGDPDACNVLLATNMISVGVDVTRFGLMVVHGQPKGIAEYIQATSRVGRGLVPGLVVSVLNHNRVRDRSHFETFPTWHSTIYREVEAASVTPFASRAQDRGLHAVLSILAMHMSVSLSGGPSLTKEARADVERIARSIAARVQAIDPGEIQNAEQRMAILIDEWERRGTLRFWWNDFEEKNSLLVSAEEKAAQVATSAERSRAWPALNSMRGVEPSVPFRLLERLRARGGTNGQEQ